MEHRTLEINVISANDINDVNLVSKMDVYVVVSVVGGPSKQKLKTAVAKDSGTSPTWNFPVRFTVDEPSVKQNRLSLVFKLRSRRALGDKDVGDVTVPIKDLLQGDSTPTQVQYLSYQVRSASSGKPKGMLNFSYKFGEKVVAEAYKGGAEPVMAYPAAAGPSAAMAGAYPPPQYGGGYPPVYPPPQYGGGYPPAGAAYPPPPGYGYGAGPAVQKPKKNKFGMGMGAGLLGGALGGLLIGDMVSDMGDYDCGDMGGFDF